VDFINADAIHKEKIAPPEVYGIKTLGTRMGSRNENSVKECVSPGMNPRDIKTLTYPHFRWIMVLAFKSAGAHL